MAFVTTIGPFRESTKKRRKESGVFYRPQFRMTMEDTSDTVAASAPMHEQKKDKKRAHHIRTRLIHCDVLSKRAEKDVFLKLDNLQPGGSFKIRGHGHLVTTHVNQGCKHFVSSSGGNAGMAVALACQDEGVHATIVVPETTPKFMVERLRRIGAEVVVHGAVWDIADDFARNMVQQEGPDAVYVSPFDDRLLWQGHASLVAELKDDLAGTKPSGIIVSVGGGGLLLGVAEGCEKMGWNDVNLVAAETIGADSFSQMLQAGKVVTLEGGITSIAKSLGALSVSQHCADLVFQHGRSVSSVVVSDKEAVEGCLLFASHHRMLVEPACGAAIAAVSKLSSAISVNDSHKTKGDGPIVVVVCGGSMASPSLLSQWIKSTGAEEAGM